VTESSEHFWTSVLSHETVETFTSFRWKFLKENNFCAQNWP